MMSVSLRSTSPALGCSSHCLPPDRSQTSDERWHDLINHLLVSATSRIPFKKLRTDVRALVGDMVPTTFVDLDKSPMLTQSSTTSTESEWSEYVRHKHPVPTAAISLPSSNQIRILKRKDVKPAARTLAQAFEHDEVARYLTHTPDRRHCTAAEQWKLHLLIMEHIVRAHVYSGLATAIGPGYGCVALWMPPGSSMEGLKARLLGGMQRWNLGPRLSSEGRKRFFSEFLPKLHDTKHDVLGEHDNDSWYLVYIGTKPQSRRQGLARKLIEHTLKEANQQSLYCYLESSNVANTAFYNKLGFQHEKYVHFTRAKRPVELDIMTRKPPNEKALASEG